MKTSTKASKIISLLRRNNGATVMEMPKTAGWREHGVRGFISGTLKKKLGLKIESSRGDGKLRRYVILGDAR